MLKTFPYREVLPYATEGSEQSLRHLDAIIANLDAAIAGQDLKGAMGLGTGSVVVHWTRELRSWLKLKHEMPLQSRIHLTRCYYSLALASSDTHMLERFVNIVVLLWKNRVLRSTTRPAEVGLDWRRLLQALKKVTFVHTSPYDANVATMVGLLARLCHAVRPLVPAEAVEALAAEVLPALTVTPPTSTASTLNMFVLMFPNLIHEEPVDGYTAKDVLPTLFYVWRLLPAGAGYDTKALEMISMVAQSEACRPSSFYGPYGILDHSQMAAVFSGILRYLDIPVAGRQTSSRPQNSGSARQIAALLIASISNYEDTHSTLDMLEGLVHTVESFTHPSSTGPWTFDIIKVVSELVEMFTLRWNIEQQGESRVPAERHLSPAVRRRFVACIADTVFYGIHSKSKVLSALSVATLQQLAYLEPDLVVPRVLAQAYSAIQGLNETHRRLTSLAALTHLLRGMAKIPRYAIHITTLLELALPCIDANDMIKTVHALALFQTAGFSVPFVDLSGDSGSALASKYLPQIVDHLETTGELPELDPAIADDLVRSTSYAFNEIAPSLLARLFLLLENMPENSSKTKQSPEYMVIHNLPTTLMAVLNSVSAEIYERLFANLLTFVTSQVIHSVTDTVAHICGAFVRTNAAYAFPRLLAMLDANIRFEVVENKAGCSRNSAPRDRALICYLSIYNMVLAAGGSQVVTHADKLLDLTVFLRESTRGQTVYHTANTIHHAIVALVSTYVVDFNFVAPGTPASLEHWGYQPDPRALDLEWHTPTRPEIEFAVRLYKFHVFQSMAAVRELLAAGGSGAATDFSDTVSYNLIYIRTVTSAIAGLIDPAAGEKLPLDVPGDEVDPRELWADRSYPTNYFFETKDALYEELHDLRRQIGEFLLAVHDALSANHSHDVTSVKEVLFVLKVWFSDVGIERSARTDHHHRLMYEFESRYFQIPGLRKPLPRTVLARRAQLHQQERLVHNAAPRLGTALEAALLERLVQSAFSIYPDIRRHAEAALYASLKVIIRARAHVYPRILEQINQCLDDQDYKAAEAGFKLLSYRTMSSMVTRDQRHVYLWLQTVLRAVQVDNHNLNIQAFETFNDSASDTFRLGLDVTYELDAEGAQAAARGSPSIQQVRVTQERKRAQSKTELDRVIALVTSSHLGLLHWRAALVGVVVLLHLSSTPLAAERPAILATLAEGVQNSHPDIKRLCLHAFSRASFQRYFGALVGGDYSAMRLDAPPVLPQSALTVPPSHTGGYRDGCPLNPAFPGQAATSYGWLAWPAALVVQDPGVTCTAPPAPEINAEWLKAFFCRQSLEPRSEEDQFDVRAAVVWAQAVAQAADDTVVAQFVAGIAASELGDRHWHRAVAELVYGVLHAQPFCPPAQRTALLSAAAQLLDRVLPTLSHETLGYWLALARWGYLSIDPNRVAPVTAAVAAARVGPGSGLRDSFRLAMHTAVISSQGATYAVPAALVDNLWANLDHPLESVRSEVSAQLSYIISSRFSAGAASVPALLAANRAAGSLGARGARYDAAALAALRAQFARLLALHAAERGDSASPDSPFRVLAKALVLLLRRLLGEPSAPALLELLPDGVLPALLAVSAIRDDADLISAVTAVFQTLAALPYPQQDIDRLLAECERALGDAVWHHKVRVLLFLQAFFFKNMFSMSAAQRGRVAETVIRVLSDPQVEVRELAAETLGGIVRASPPGEQEALTTACAARFQRLLQTTRGLPERLVQRHAAVLGLGALVNAYPYASPPPPWVPMVLATLAVKASADGGVVGKSVKATLGDFKRTRQDTWHIDQLAFTTDQLDDLEGVLWKNYFV